jgi:hypothetical protein
VRRASRGSTAGEAGTLAVEGESARIDRGWWELGSGGMRWRRVVEGENEVVAM